jgi:hypothetical protein
MEILSEASGFRLPQMRAVFRNCGRNDRCHVTRFSEMFRHVRRTVGRFHKPVLFRCDSSP